MADQDSTEQFLELLIQLKKTTPKAARDILNARPAISYALISLMVSIGAINIEVFQKTLAQYHESNGRGNGTPGGPVGVGPPATTLATISAPTTVPTTSALPPHLQPQPQQYRTATPPTNVPTPPSNVYGYPNHQQAYNTPGPSQQQGYPQPSGYPAYGGQPQQQPQPQSQPQPQMGYGNYPPIPVASLSAGYGAGAGAGIPVGGRPGQPQQQQQQQSTPATFRPEMLATFPEDQKALIMHVISMTPEQMNNLSPEQRGTYMQIRATLGIS